MSVEATGMIGRRAVPLTVAVSLVWVSLFWVNPMPAAAREPLGWRPVFSESFNNPAKLPSGCTAYEGATDGPAASYFRAEAVTVSEGMLRLGMIRRTAAGKPYTTGELRCPGTAQRYGRYEFRARVPAGAGIGSILTLRPVDAAAQRHLTRVELLARPGDEKAFVSNGYGTGVNTHTVPGALSDFHTYVLESAPTGFRLFVDDRERLIDPRVSTEARWFGLGMTAGEPRTGLPTSATALPAEFAVDYLRIWAYDPSAAPIPASSTSDTPARAASGPTGGGTWSGWLAGAAAVTALLVVIAFVVRGTRPRRPPSSHRL